MNRNLWLLGLTQALFLANNITFSAINGLVGARIAPYPWMATLPVMGYVVGGALSAVLESPRLVAGLNDVAVMRETVEQRRCHLGIAEHAPQPLRPCHAGARQSFR